MVITTSRYLVMMTSFRVQRGKGVKKGAKMAVILKESSLSCYTVLVILQEIMVFSYFILK